MAAEDALRDLINEFRLEVSTRLTAIETEQAAFNKIWVDHLRWSERTKEAIDGELREHQTFIDRAKMIGILVGLLWGGIVAWLTKVTAHIYDWSIHISPK